MKTKFELRRDYVNKEFAKKTRGKTYSLEKKTRILKMLWRQAKRKYK